MAFEELELIQYFECDLRLWKTPIISPGSVWLITSSLIPWWRLCADEWQMSLIRVRLLLVWQEGGRHRQSEHHSAGASATHLRFRLKLILISAQLCLMIICSICPTQCKPDLCSSNWIVWKPVLPAASVFWSNMVLAGLGNTRYQDSFLGPVHLVQRHIKTNSYK